VNQDGKTSGITAPNQESQTLLVQEVYDKYQIDPGNIQLIEAHGTGTKLGDPIEVEGLKQAFRKYTRNKEFCALGSVKSNIGHCLTAAGITGFIKLLLALKNEQLPPTINFERLNDYIDLNESPFFVQTRLQPWKRNGAERRQAAISSFGFSGTNAHIVVGEYLPPAGARLPQTEATEDMQILVPVSARTGQQLKQKARDLLHFVRQRSSTINPIEVAYTLQVGREPMEQRLGMMVSSIGELVEKLKAYVAGEPGIDGVFQGQVKRDKASLSSFTGNIDVPRAVDQWIANRQLSRLLELWVKGLEFDWNKLYGDIKPRRIALPLYPFAKERYWIEPVPGPHAVASVLHPLLHHNTSDLSEQRYSSIFTGEEFFFAGQKVVPGIVNLEMARAAIGYAWPLRPESTIIELLHTTWAQPIAIDPKKQVSIALVERGHERIEYEIYSQDTGREIVHCQGTAVLSREPAPPKLDIEQLKRQIGNPMVEPDRVAYPPAFQNITGLCRGSSQLLAELRFPGIAADRLEDYLLLLTLIDGTLQAAAPLVEGRSCFECPRVWLAMDSLRIVSLCTQQMFAWVRLGAPGGRPEGKVVTLDVDLCDKSGNSSMQIRGLSFGPAQNQTSTIAAQDQTIVTLLAVPVWQPGGVVAPAEGSRMKYSEHHLILCDLPGVDAGQLQALQPNRRPLLLQTAESKPIAQRYREYALACFEHLQSILARKPQGKVLVQVVIADHPEHAALAGLSGMLKSAALENSQLMGQLIVAHLEITAGELDKHLQQEEAGALEPLIRYKDGMRQVLYWQELQPDEAKAPIPFENQATYLIAGGIGALGMLFAEEIFKQTSHARVVLTGRSALTVDKLALLNRLCPQPGRLSYRQVELEDLDQVEELITALRDQDAPLKGILHCAGMIADNPILKKDSTQFSAVLAPKVTGTYNLDLASQDVQLDFFALFSSVAGVIGNAGQTDYATANGFLDQFARHRNLQVAAGQRHGRTRSISWPLWQAGGMGMNPVAQELVRQTAGMEPMPTSTGIHAFYRCLALAHDQVLILHGSKIKMMSYLRRARMLEPADTAEQATSGPYTKAEPEPQLRQEQLRQQLKVTLAAVLHIDSSIIDMDQPFVEFGLDSFLGAELVVAINKKYGTELSHLMVFDHPTVSELALFLAQEIEKRTGRPTDPSPFRTLVPMSRSFPVLQRRLRGGRSTLDRHPYPDDKIAVVGMSGRYPKASGLPQYWSNLAEGRNCVEEVPRARWNVDRYYDPVRGKLGKTNSKWLGALDEFDCFDPLFFRISPHDAEHIDPQHRLFLQEGYKAFDDAGYSPASLSDRKCGVYLGISTNEYTSLLLRSGVVSAPVTSNSYAIAAARIAYHLNLKGPAIAVDTACSSSLVAIHLAAQALLSGETDMALAGGVTLWLTPESFLAMSQAGMFSSQGQCKTFDDSADGIVNGEGVGVVVLKRLEDAQRDNDSIYGVILGSGINQDGKTNGITAPSVNSQIELERTVYSRYKIDPESISYIETHGTGTKLGDPIELDALATVFKEKTSRKNFCALGSVKSNIGHTTAAAGIASLQKVLLSMRHRTLVPSLHVTKENSHFDFQNSPFYINREKQAWAVAAGSSRRAAVSSFGFSGTNAHMVVEEYSSPIEPAILQRDNTPFIVPLSARTPEQLRQKASDLLEFLRGNQPCGSAVEPSTARSQSVDLASVAYTLQIGRDAMAERLGFIVSSVDHLAEKLSRFVDGDNSIEDAYRGLVDPGNECVTIIDQDDDMQEAIDKWLARKKLSKILDLWIRGLNVDWNKLYGDAQPRRISLPTYPFAKERYWIKELPSGPVLNRNLELDESMKSIEEIINQIGDEMTETGQAVQALKMLV
jgi:polyketide synthase PksN